MDDYLTRFRNKTNIEQAVAAKISDIIAQSLSRMEVTLNGALQAIPVAFINDDKESGDESIMYSYHTAGVTVGDYIAVFGKSHLVYKEIKNIKREDYIDCFKTIYCNTSFNFNGSTIKAYFKGSLRSATSDESDTSQNFGVDSFVAVYIMIPSSVTLETNVIISIDGNGWRTTKRDDTTNPGIAYIALEEYNIPNLDKTSSEEVIAPVAPFRSMGEQLPIILAGVTQSLTTEDGYITTSKSVNILERKSTIVKFIIPFGIETITIDIKNKGQVVSTNYQVRG